MGAPLGNQNAVQGKEISNAIRRALARNNWARLHAGAEKLADAFAAGQPWALQMTLDRFEGRSKQQVDITQSGDSRELGIADLMRVILAARSASATDTQVLDSQAIPALPADPDPPMPLG